MATAKAGKRDAEMRDKKRGSCEKRKKRRQKTKRGKMQAGTFNRGKGARRRPLLLPCSVNPETSEAFTTSVSAEQSNV